MDDLRNVFEELIAHGLVVGSILDGGTVLRKQDHPAKMSLMIDISRETG
jgi:hypothetical protein